MKKVIVLFIISFSVLNLKAQNESCPVGEISLLLNLNACPSGTYTCCLYMYGEPNPIKCINMTMPNEHKVIAVDFFCAGSYRWIVNGPVNFSTCYLFYTPLSPQLTFNNNCEDCSADDRKK